jgi:hypothetical protein
MKPFVLSLALWLLPAGLASAVNVSSGTLNFFIFNGDQGWTNVVPSTTTASTPTQAVALSSCAVLMADPSDCYFSCIQANGTLSRSPANWVTCPE